jgi:hypothetical protein
MVNGTWSTPAGRDGQAGVSFFAAKINKMRL